MNTRVLAVDPGDARIGLALSIGSRRAPQDFSLPVDQEQVDIVLVLDAQRCFKRVLVDVEGDGTLASGLVQAATVVADMNLNRTRVIFREMTVNLDPDGVDW